MILRSLMHAGWPALFVCAGAVACSKTPAVEGAYVAATLGPASGSNLCPLGPNTPVVSVGTTNIGAPVTSGPIETPMTIPDGESSLSVDCTVAPSGDGFQLQLSAAIPGSSGGNLIIQGHVDGDTGGTVSAQFVSQSASVAFNSADCMLTYMYGSQMIPAGQRIAAGQIFAHISCPDAMSEGGSISGQQVTTEDGGSATATCDGEADFIFTNCAEQ
jgi:hypothetical protein